VDATPAGPDTEFVSDPEGAQLVKEYNELDRNFSELNQKSLQTELEVQNLYELLATSATSFSTRPI